MDEEKRKHHVEIENREKIIITDVEDVESFDENKVVIITTMGAMTVSGGDFRINKLNVDDGQLVIEGIIDEIKYSEIRRHEDSGGFFASLFR